MIPESDLAQLQQWVDAQNSGLPESARDKIRYELDVTNRAVTILECRPPWKPDLGPNWSRLPLARLRYTKYLKVWSLYWVDRNSLFHEYDLIEPTADIGRLIAEVERDPTGIFGG